MKCRGNDAQMESTAVVEVQMDVLLGPKRRPKDFKLSPRGVQEGQVESKRRPRGSKLTPRGVQEAPSGAQEASKSAKLRPRGSKLGPRGRQEAPS